MTREPHAAQRLRIYLGERDKAPSGHPLWEEILKEARTRGLSGVTVLKGVAGYGAHSRVHTTKILRLSEDLPFVIEIIDEASRLAEFLPWLEDNFREGLVTREDCQVLIHRPEHPPKDA